MNDVPKLFYRPEECATALAIGRTRIFAALASGQLRSVRLGRSRRVPVSALLEFADRLESEGELAAK